MPVFYKFPRVFKRGDNILVWRLLFLPL